MKLNRATAVLNAIIGSILLAGVLAFAGLDSLRHFARTDLTADQVFTLTDATKQVVASLDKYPLKITAYFSERLPKTIKPRIDWIRDLLSEYKAFGHGNVKVEFVDPGAPDFSPAEKDNVEKGYGVRPIELREMEKDSAVALKCYLSIVLVYGDKHERIDLFDEKEPLLDPSGTLLGFEYALTRCIVKVSQEELKGVGVIADKSTPPPKQPDQDPGTGYRHINDLLEKQYRVRDVDVKRGQLVPDDIDTLIVAKPKNLSEREAFEIDQFVMRGGKLIVFADHYDADVGQGIKTKPITTGIDALLEGYGLKLGGEMVADVMCGAVMRRLNAILTQQFAYPFFVIVGPEGFDTANPIVSHLKGVQLPWVSPVDIVADKTQGNKVDKLIRSSANSWTATDVTFVELARVEPPSGAQTGSRILAAAVSGKFQSSFAGKPIPKPSNADKPKKPGEPDMPDSSEEIEKADAARQVVATSPDTRVILFGSGTVINDSFLTSPQTGLFSQSLLLNAVDWCTVGDQLIGIRTRAIQNEGIEEVSDSKKGIARWSNVLGLPVLLLIFWAIRRFFRGRAGATYLSAARG
ncbi:MAG: GldG family protein [Planctomycetes bacterium]|nr:GldG family protein [Planctomycetota bacterium]